MSLKSLSLNDHGNRESRILVWSQRNIQNFIYNSCLYEFEDIIGEVDATQIIAPPQYDLMGRGVKKLVKTHTQQVKSLANLNPYRQSINLEQEYDVFFTILDFSWNVSSINCLKNRQKKCKYSVCYIIELWRKDLSKLKNFIEYFQNFDLICLGHSEIVEDVQKITNRPCIYLAPGVDTVKFYPNLERDRTIDLCTLGRRSPVTHQSLLQLAEQKNFFYHYSYISGAGFRSNKHQEHRTFTANLLKNSRYFITNYAKVNQPEQTQGQIEIGYRFFEGAAAGNILIGCPPKNKAFEQYFSWKNAVIPLDFNEPNIANIIADLDAQPEYLREIQTANVVNSLRQHDWVYRWEQVLKELGLSTTEAMEERKIYLQQLAQTCLGNLSNQNAIQSQASGIQQERLI